MEIPYGPVASRTSDEPVEDLRFFCFFGRVTLSILFFVVLSEPLRCRRTLTSSSLLRGSDEPLENHKIYYP